MATIKAFFRAYYYRTGPYESFSSQIPRAGLDLSFRVCPFWQPYIWQLNEFLNLDLNLDSIFTPISDGIYLTCVNIKSNPQFIY